jgi:hypothetical protein
VRRGRGVRRHRYANTEVARQGKVDGVKLLKQLRKKLVTGLWSRRAGTKKGENSTLFGVDRDVEKIGGHACVTDG